MTADWLIPVYIFTATGILLRGLDEVTPADAVSLQ